MASKSQQEKEKSQDQHPDHTLSEAELKHKEGIGPRTRYCM
jgi:hypothetical protein